MKGSLVVRDAAALAPGAQLIEVVERKGIGHPDTICDALAEQICRRLCRHYQERFGVILHHNVDKLLLCGGSARPRYGGGEVTYPIELYLGGRATREYRGEHIPVDELAIDACRDWLRASVPGLDPERHVRIVSRIRPGSGDLTRLFVKGITATPLASDTSCGAGFAPFSDLERVVLAVEQTLTGAEARRACPAIGPDIKVMGVRRGRQIDLTISCALVDRFLADIDEYLRKKSSVRALALDAARRVTQLEVNACVNVADDVERGDVFLTVTGTSAEAGDDGEVGRGNRVCGLITPYRPMTLEAAAGKNPVSHVGKLYNLAAGRIARAIVESVAGVLDASCVLVSQIGHPINDPQIVDVRLGLESGRRVDDVTGAVQQLVSGELSRFGELRDSLLAGLVTVY